VRASSWILSALALLAGACTSSPHEIRVDQGTMSIYSKTATALHATAIDKNGNALGDVALTYTAVSPDVATVEPQGSVRCHKSGDAAVVVAGANLNSTVRISCRLATSILLPAAQRLVLGEASQPIKASVLNESGELIDGAPTVFISSNETVVRAADRQLTAVGIGKATLTATLGDAKAELSVEVLEVVQRQALALSDGATQVLTLNPGSYEIDIVAVAGGGYGVTAQWVGARCPPVKEAQRHQLRGAFSEPASLRIENPTLLGMGDLAAGHLTVYRIAAL